MLNIQNKFRIGADVCILLAMMLLILPLRWIFAAVIAGAVHEISHWLAVVFCGNKIYAVKIGRSGAVMDAGILGPWQQIFCLLAGSVGGLLLLTFVGWFPRIAVCGAIQGLYNLLPLETLDGGKALRQFFMILCPGRAERLCSWVQNGCMVAIGLIGLYGSLWLRLGYLPAMLAAVIILRTKSAKTPCKDAALGLQ